MPLAVGGPQFIPSLGPCFLSVAKERDLFRLSLCMPGRYEKENVKQVYVQYGIPLVGEENEEGGAKK